MSQPDDVETVATWLDGHGQLQKGGPWRGGESRKLVTNQFTLGIAV